MTEGIWIHFRKFLYSTFVVIYHYICQMYHNILHMRFLRIPYTVYCLSIVSIVYEAKSIDFWSKSKQIDSSSKNPSCSKDHKIIIIILAECYLNLSTNIFVSNSQIKIKLFQFHLEFLKRAMLTSIWLFNEVQNFPIHFTRISM